MPRQEIQQRDYYNINSEEKKTQNIIIPKHHHQLDHHNYDSGEPKFQNGQNFKTPSSMADQPDGRGRGLASSNLERTLRTP